MEEHIQYDFLFDNHFTELKEIEMINERLNLVNQMQPFLGVYYSNDYVKRQILQQTEQEIIDIANQIKKEKSSGELMDIPIAPVEQDPMATPPPKNGPKETKTKDSLKAQAPKKTNNKELEN
jgi:hypothetical protein